MVEVVVGRAGSMSLNKQGPLLSIHLLTARFHTVAVCDFRHA